HDTHSISDLGHFRRITQASRICDLPERVVTLTRRGLQICAPITETVHREVVRDSEQIALEASPSRSIRREVGHCLNEGVLRQVLGLLLIAHNASKKVVHTIEATAGE